ncbi:hypothetical protein HIM_11242 [Hirsutella minnesotensis 3608]|uniref:PNPLA domain-containing protein n=1 Tax=Hirsutella minnesotensis 3608 TaxID=1043627 RepID=A0A0F7ZJ76_9HYPO|nr:hypothetical protein HIM_11242 [Hirsutella minnesotensis 3608]
MPGHDIRLLALDGGGVRGLSSLMILQNLMSTIAAMMDIQGNDEAHALAKAGSALPEPADALPTLAHLRRVARQRPKEASVAWWEGLCY